MNRVIFPALNPCEVCGQAESEHKTSAQKEDSHPYKRDDASPMIGSPITSREGVISFIDKPGRLAWNDDCPIFKTAFED